MKRHRERVEHEAYLDMLGRMIRAGGRRVADGDEVDLAQLLSLQEVLEQAIQDGVDGIRSRGMSWAYIAQATGTTRQAAQMRWGKRDAA